MSTRNRNPAPVDPRKRYKRAGPAPLPSPSPGSPFRPGSGGVGTPTLPPPAPAQWRDKLQAAKPVGSPMDRYRQKAAPGGAPAAPAPSLPPPPRVSPTEGQVPTDLPPAPPTMDTPWSGPASPAQPGTLPPGPGAPRPQTASPAFSGASPEATPKVAPAGAPAAEPYAAPSSGTTQQWGGLFDQFGEIRPDWFTEGGEVDPESELGQAVLEGGWDAANALLMRESFAFDNPAIAESVAGMDPLDFQGLLDQMVASPDFTIDDYGEAMDRLGEFTQQWGDAPTFLTPEEWNQVMSIIGDTAVEQLEGPARAEINTIMGEARVRHETQRIADEVIDPLIQDYEQWMDTELWSEQDQEAYEQLRRYATGEIQFITGEYVDRQVQEAERLINRTFGSQANLAGTVGAARGQAGSAFAAQMAHQLQARSLEAKIGAQNEALNFQEATNAKLQMESMRLFNMTGDMKRARTLQANRLLSDLKQLQAGMEAGAISSPQDFTDWPLLTAGLDSMIQSMEQWEAENPSDAAGWVDQIVDSFLMALSGVLPQQFARSFQGVFLR